MYMLLCRVSEKETFHSILESSGEIKQCAFLNNSSQMSLGLLIFVVVVVVV